MRQRGPLLGSWYRKFSGPLGLGKASDNCSSLSLGIVQSCLCLSLLIRLSLCEALTLCFPPPAYVADFPGYTPKLHLHMTLEFQGPPVDSNFSIPSFSISPAPPALSCHRAFIHAVSSDCKFFLPNLHIRAISVDLNLCIRPSLTPMSKTVPPSHPPLP